MLAAGCGSHRVPAKHAAPPTLPNATPQRTAAVGALGCSPRITHVPCARNARVGVAYEFDLGTHCGVTDTYLAGRIWVPTRKIGSGGNPPPWLDNPFQRGRMLLASKTRAVFTAHGHTITFRPAAKGFRPPRCE